MWDYVWFSHSLHNGGTLPFSRGALGFNEPIEDAHQEYFFIPTGHDCADTDPGALGDIADGGFAIAVGGKEFFGGTDDVVLGFCPGGFASHGVGTHSL